jgi:hypothetical protein
MSFRRTPLLSLNDKSNKELKLFCGMQSQQINGGGSKRINAAEFASKYKSKREIFNFLTVSAGAYLCPHECLTIYFLKQLVSGERKCKCYRL